eukprot:s738_g6.t1
MPKVDSLNVVSDHRVTARRARQKGMQVCTMQDDELQMVTIGAKWRQNGATAVVSKIQDGKIYLRKVKGCLISGMISQHRPSANPIEILKSAEDFWRGYWNTANNAKMDDEMVQDAILSLPCLPEMELHFNIKDLDWVLSALPQRKARGMDGFSNYEIKNLPELLKPRLVALFNLFSQGLWPSTLCKARMALLYKTSEVGDIATTRPITILATMYRTWAKLVTKKMLHHIRKVLPETLFGSVPGKSSMDMVSEIQMLLEKALIQNEPLAGISLDFSKAYNTLPRNFLKEANKRLGFSKLWHTYGSFLDKLERHFTCGPSWGCGIRSTTGVPEGCPIAVVQMIILTWSFTNLLKQQEETPPFFLCG